MISRIEVTIDVINSSSSISWTPTQIFTSLFIFLYVLTPEGDIRRVLIGIDIGVLFEARKSGQNQNSLLVKRQNDNTSPGDWSRKIRLALTREVNLDTQSSDSSAEEMRESGRTFQSLIVWRKKLFK